MDISDTAFARGAREIDTPEAEAEAHALESLGKAYLVLSRRDVIEVLAEPELLLRWLGIGHGESLTEAVGKGKISQEEYGLLLKITARN